MLPEVFKAMNGYKNFPFRGPFSLKTKNKRETSILDWSRQEVLSGTTVRIHWIYKVLCEYWKATNSKG